MAKSQAPFPDEKQLLEFIRENPGRASKREITRAFKIKGEDKIKLKKLIRKMTVDGKLDKPHKSRLSITGELPPVLVVEIDGPDQHGDLTARPQKWDELGDPPKILMYSHDKRNKLALGDTALVRLNPNTDKGESGYVAKVIRKIEKSSSQVMGVFRKDDEHIAFVTPTDKKDRNQYLVPKNDWNGAKEGSLVLIQVKTAQSRSRNMKAKPAKVLKTFGSMDDAKSISLIAIIAQGIPLEFPDEVLAEAKKSEEPILANRT
ncbi:MAG: hypothetical protein P8H03_03510, partial [Emcibacteraceae bacterium]|nr:hypothetical protein [Emcibacteraceae bacterium]